MIHNYFRNNSAARRIIFHAINHTGLGHLSRLTAIASAVREIAPDTALLFIVDGSSHGILETANIPFISLSFLGNVSDWPLWSADRKERLMPSLAGSIIRTMSPELLVFDSFSNHALLSSAHREGVPLAVCIRKVKNIDELGKKFRALARSLRLILVPHEPEEMKIPEEFAAKTKFVGTIVRSPSLEISDEMNPRCQIVITGGGGGYPGTVNFYNTALEAFAICRRTLPHLSGVLVAGPLFQEWRRLALVDGIRVIPFDPHVSTLFKSADIVICQAGYNTIAELVSLQVPVICIPGHRQFDDQFERSAQAASRHGQIRLCLDADAPSLAAMISDAMQHSPRPAAPVIPNIGARLAAEHLLAVIDGFRSGKVELLT